MKDKTQAFRSDCHSRSKPGKLPQYYVDIPRSKNTILGFPLSMEKCVRMITQIFKENGNNFR